MKKVIKRIINKDLKSIQNLKNIYVEFDEFNMIKAKAIIIGPKNTRYQDSILLFEIEFTKDYPYSPPILKYISRNNIRIHPNLYVSGKICLSFLGTWIGPKWTSIMDISTILLSIQSLLDENPLRHEPGYDTIKGVLNETYNNIIDYNSIDSLIIDQYNNLPTDYLIFKDRLKEHIIENKNDIEKKIKNNIDINQKYVSNIYRIHLIANYNLLYDKYNKFISNI
tara:strand:- start:2978 stop:3649 length:672 start_codon:yes stop_codon:yes gene_type:complete